MKSDYIKLLYHGNMFLATVLPVGRAPFMAYFSSMFSHDVYNITAPDDVSTNSLLTIVRRGDLYSKTVSICLLQEGGEYTKRLMWSPQKIYSGGEG